MAMSHLIHLMQNDPYFKQALKDFENLGFIKVNGENINIVNREGIKKYIKEFHTKHDKH
tara:strand:+ start:596 stop:772 length:177 start_codon:yes stop_codon:yes gene_type:complete